MDFVKSSPGHGEVMVGVQPFPDARAENCGVKEIWAKTGLFAAMHGDTPFFMQEAWIAERGVRPHRLPKKKFSLLVDKVICFSPPVEGPDAALPLVALHPFPVNCDGEGRNPGMNDLKAIEAGLCEVNVPVSGALDGGLTVQGDRDPSGSDVMEATEEIKEAQGAQNSRKFTPARGLILRQTCSQIVAHRLEGKRGPGGVWCHDKSRRAPLPVVLVGAVADDGRGAGGNGIRKHHAGVLGARDSVQEDTWVGGRTITVVAKRVGGERKGWVPEVIRRGR